MFIVGMMCNAFVGFMANHVSMVVLTSKVLPTTLPFYPNGSNLSALGTLGTAMACLLFAIVDPKVIYWAYCFPAMLLSVLGVDIVYTAGTLYVAKISLPHEQSLAGALFQTMTEVSLSHCLCYYHIFYSLAALGFFRLEPRQE